jgi:metal-dependent HD superfamily phosphatase/phosphodiesterase
MSKITVSDIKKSKKVRTFLEQTNINLGAMGYTDHGLRHAAVVSKIAGEILRDLNFNQRKIELAEIAGYMHDIGNFIGRKLHYNTGAILALDILVEMGMSDEEAAIIAGAIGNHEEDIGVAVNDIAAALILADKSDVHRSRVTNKDERTFDIHDRVNYSALESNVIVKNGDKRLITLEIKIDTEISKVMEYFEIFLSRMIMCRNAATHLNAEFKLVINENELL